MELSRYYVLTPSMPLWDVDEFTRHFNGRRLDYGFAYNSYTNPVYLSVEEIREQIRQHVDAAFVPR